MKEVSEVCSNLGLGEVKFWSLREMQAAAKEFKGKIAGIVIATKIFFRCANFHFYEHSRYNNAACRRLRKDAWSFLLV
jgi:hypothetical protein